MGKKTAAKASKAKATKVKAKVVTPAKKMKTAARGESMMKKAAASVKLPTAPITEKQTKAAILAEIANVSGLGKAEVKALFSALRNLTERHLKVKGSGEFVIPEVGIKVRRVQRPATKARMGRNPLTGQEIEIAAKPARKSVKATAMKALKALAN